MKSHHNITQPPAPPDRFGGWRADATARPALASWAIDFARHLEGLGATDGLEVLTDLAERFHPVYGALDACSVADAVWAHWPLREERGAPASGAAGGNSSLSATRHAGH